MTCPPVSLRVALRVQSWTSVKGLCIMSNYCAIELPFGITFADLIVLLDESAIWYELVGKSEQRLPSGNIAQHYSPNEIRIKPFFNIVDSRAPFWYYPDTFRSAFHSGFRADASVTVVIGISDYDRSLGKRVVNDAPHLYCRCKPSYLDFAKIMLRQLSLIFPRYLPMSRVRMMWHRFDFVNAGGVSLDSVQWGGIILHTKNLTLYKDKYLGEEGSDSDQSGHNIWFVDSKSGLYGYLRMPLGLVA